MILTTSSAVVGFVAVLLLSMRGLRSYAIFFACPASQPPVYFLPLLLPVYVSFWVMRGLHVPPMYVLLHTFCGVPLLYPTFTFPQVVGSNLRNRYHLPSLLMDGTFVCMLPFSLFLLYHNFLCAPNIITVYSIRT